MASKKPSKPRAAQKPASRRTKAAASAEPTPAAVALSHRIILNPTVARQILGILNNAIA